MSNNKLEQNTNPHSGTSRPDKAATAVPPRIGPSVYILYAVCALLILIDPFVHKHGPFDMEHVWGLSLIHI